MSESGKRIDALVRASVAPLLRSHGFRGSGRTFHRQVDSVVQVVNVQASQWNFAESARFTINLGVFFPEVQRYLDPERMPDKPKEYQCTVRARISQALGAKEDLWWDLRPETDLEALGSEVSGALETSGFRWLAQHTKLETVPGALKGRAVPEAAALLALGREEDARVVMSAALAKGGPAEAYFRRFAGKHGLLQG